MPIDGITFTYPVTSFAAYRKAVPALDWFTPKNANTGLPAMSQSKLDKGGRYSYTTITHTSKFEGLFLKAKEIFRTAKNNNTAVVNNYQCELEITGSLHVHFFGHNSGAFKFTDLQNEIKDIQKRLCIDLDKAIIENMETGVNLPFKFEPDVLLSNLLIYKGHTFNRYKDVRAGRYCPLLSDLEIKIYNKGFLAETPENIIRYELHYSRMRGLNKIGIKSLSDLQKEDIVARAIELLLKVWDNILVYPGCIIKEHPEKLTILETDFLTKSRAPEYWRDLYKNIARTGIKKKRDRLKELDRVKGNDIHNNISKLIGNVWGTLFDDGKTDIQTTKRKEADNYKTGVTFVQSDKCLHVHDKGNECRKHINQNKHMEGNECHVKIKGTNVTPLKMRFIITPDNVNKQQCVTCGKDLNPKQRQGSKFCSAKYTNARDAKKCRNHDSNKRKNKIKLNSVIR